MDRSLQLRRHTSSLLATLALAAGLETAASAAPAAPTPEAPAIFTDITNDVGLDFVHYNAEAGELDLPEITGPGGALFDQDGDGDLDVYVLNFGPNQLWRNDGARLVDISASSGTTGSTDKGSEEWSIAATFVDIDGDGLLDLYVVNYTDFPVDPPIRCYARTSRRDYCGPSAFTPTADRLFRNRGDGVFEDISQSSGIARVAGPGLGVLAARLNGGRFLDLYVTNDGAANFLFQQSAAAATFDDDALLAGVALNQLGQPEASMGVDAGDFDRDGDLDLFLTHLSGEKNTLYVNLGDGLWEDRTTALGLASPSRAMTGFGTVWIDYDNDGWLDLAAVNGRVLLPTTVQGTGGARDLVQPNQLFRNQEGRGFVDVSASAGAAFVGPETSRGLARGDFDNDGDTDLLLLNNGGRARLLRNDADGANWIGVRALERGRDALGALVELVTDELVPVERGTARPTAPRRLLRIATDGSYASASDPRALFGLGTSPDVTAVQVTWPDGQREAFPPPARGKYITLIRGQGKVTP